jgi:hypothetical protein
MFYVIGELLFYIQPVVDIWKDKSPAEKAQYFSVQQARNRESLNIFPNG